MSTTFQGPLLSEALWLKNWQPSTYVSATSFTVPGNQTAQYQPGVTVQVLSGSNYLYSFVISSTFSTTTTTVVITDAVLTNVTLSTRVSDFDPNNNSLSRYFREAQVVGPNGVTISNAAGAKLTMTVPGVGSTTTGYWQLVANTSGQLTLTSGLTSAATQYPIALISTGTNGAPSGIQLLAPETITTATSSSNQVQLFNHSNASFSYAFYSDNVGENNASSRFWIGAPVSGEVAIGPRDGTGPMNVIRLRAQSVQIENAAGGYGTGGEVWHSKNLNPSIYAQQGLSNTWTSGIAMPMQATLTTAANGWGQYQPTTTGAPAATYGVVHTVSNIGDSFVAANGTWLSQQAFDASNQAMYLRFNTNNGGWSSWAQVYTSANFNPGAYVPLAGNVTVTSPVNFATGINLQLSAGAPALNFKSVSGIGNAYDGRIYVTGGTGGSVGQGAMTINAVSLSTPATTVNGLLTATQSLTVLGPQVNLSNIGFLMVNGGNSAQLQFQLGGVSRNVIYNDSSANLNFGGYNGSGTFLGSAMTITSALVVTINSLQVNTNASVNNLTTNGQVINNNYVVTNGTASYVVNGRSASYSYYGASDFYSPSGGAVGVHHHAFGSYYNFGQGLQISWNDYSGEGSGTFTCHRGGGGGGFRFRSTADGVGFASLFFINGSGQAYTGSDIRLKDLKGDLSVAESIKFVTEMRAKIYSWKHNGQLDFGFVAQDAQKHAPRLVWHDKTIDQLNLEYQKVAVYHHEVLNLVYKRTNDHETDIQFLLHKVEQQDKEIASLKGQLGQLVVHKKLK